MREALTFLQISETLPPAIGTQTLQAVNAADPITLIDDICDQQLAFLQSLPTFDTFGRGWTARVQRVRSRLRADAAGSRGGRRAGRGRRLRRAAIGNPGPAVCRQMPKSPFSRPGYIFLGTGLHYKR
jgi:hypothetical protein